MDLKKFVSCASAFTIAASAFAAMAVTASAYDTVTYEFNDTTVGNGGWSIATGSGSSTAYVAMGENDYALKYQNTGTGGARAATFSFDSVPDATTDYVVEFDFAGRGGNSGNTTVQLRTTNGNIASLTTNGNSSYNILVDGNDTVISGSGDTDLAHYKFVVDRTNNKTYATVTKGSDTLIDTKAVTSTAASDATLSQIYINVPRSYNGYGVFDNIVIRETADGDIPDVAQYTVTTHYVDEDSNQLKNDTAVSVGEGEDFTPVYDESFNLNGYKYTYLSGGDVVENITEAQEVTIVYSKRELVTAEVTISAAGDIQKELLTTTVLEDETAYYNYPRYIVDDGKVYETTPASSADSKGFQQKVVGDGTTAMSATINYTQAYTDALDAVLVEAEDIAGVTVGTDTARMSDGKGGKTTEDTVVATLPAGEYTLVMDGRNPAKSATGDVTIYAGTVEIGTYTINGYLSQATYTFTIDEETDIIASAIDTTSDQRFYIDYFLFVKTGAVTPEPPTPVAATGTDYVGTDGSKASLWNATVTTNSATKVTAVATLADGETTAGGEAELDGTFTGDVAVYVVVNKAVAELQGVAVTFE